LHPNASAWGSRTWMPACCRVACLVASRNWFRELRMSRDIQAFVIGLDIPTISRTGRCSNHFDFMMRPASRLITNAQLFEKHCASWDYNWRSLSASPAQVCGVAKGKTSSLNQFLRRLPEAANESSPQFRIPHSSRRSASMSEVGCVLTTVYNTYNSYTRGECR